MNNEAPQSPILTIRDLGDAAAAAGLLPSVLIVQAWLLPAASRPAG